METDGGVAIMGCLGDGVRGRAIINYGYYGVISEMDTVDADSMGGI
jgi:hypothetical protein